MKWFVLLAGGCLICAPAAGTASQHKFTDKFDVDKTELASVGTNRFLNLTPGFRLVLEGTERGKKTVLIITVLNQTERVDGVETRVVEERETINGELAEVSRNFFAISTRTSDVFYFGEDVDFYKGGKVVGHEGSWRAGVRGATFGLAMPGRPLLGAKYYQEIAPKVAMDRAEVVSLGAEFNTPAGRFDGCLETEEGSPLEKAKERKLYAPGIGLIFDGELKLVKYGREAL